MSTSVSSVIKFFPSAQNGFQTTLASTVASGATTVPLNSVAGYNNGEIAVMVVDPTSATLKQTFTGVVDTAGVQLTSVVWTAGTNASHAGGATVVDYATATHISMMSKGIKVQHAQDGTHTNVTATGLAVTGASTLTGVLTVAGSWDSWVGANETWTYASASTITVPTDATTKYDVGDVVKLTQSSTVKYFVVVTVASTLLTVTGLGGATVANSAITLNAYSKSRNPHGALAGAVPFNPYKFSVWRNAAWTTGGGAVLVPYDTKEYDTSSNVDLVTNKGRFTAPIAGFYHFDGIGGYVAAITGDNIQAFLYKNGSVAKQGPVGQTINTGSMTAGVSDTIQLAANDYVEVFIQNQSGTNKTGVTGQSTIHFSGFLVSAI